MPDASTGALPVVSNPAPAARVAVPSKGCELATDAFSKMDQSYYSIGIPVGYDGSNPLPMVWAFHGGGGNNDELVYYGQSQLARDYVMVYPEWSARDYEASKALVDAMWQEVVDTYCVDLAHVFATGFDEGAQLLVHMLCDNDTRFAAVAPIDASNYCATVAPLPVLYMGGRLNAQRPAGTHEQVAEMFALSNGCSTSQPYSAVKGCSLGSFNVNPGCVEYQGCSKTTQFCYFSEPQAPAGYGGRPCFGTTAMYDFFQAIP